MIEGKKLQTAEEMLDGLVIIALHEGWNAGIEECQKAIASTLEEATVDIDTLSIVDKINESINALIHDNHSCPKHTYKEVNDES